MPYPTDPPACKHDLHCPQLPPESSSLQDAIGFQTTGALFQALQQAVPENLMGICSLYSYPDAPKPPLSSKLLVIGVAHMSLTVVRKLIGDDDDSDGLPDCLQKCTIAVKRGDKHHRYDLLPKDVHNSDAFAKFSRRLRRDGVVAILSQDKLNRFGILQPSEHSNGEGEPYTSDDFFANVFVGKVDEVKRYLTQGVRGGAAAAEPEQAPNPPWGPQTPPVEESDGLWQPPGASNNDDDNGGGGGLWQPPGTSSEGEGLWQPPTDPDNQSSWQPSTTTTWDAGTSNGNSNKRKFRDDDDNDDKGDKFHADSGAAAADAFYSGLTRTLDTRADSRIFHMRAFNGWVKATQIQELDPRTRGLGRKQDSPLRILDLACGKGGDLGKWILHPRGVANYVGIDVARGSLRDAAIRARTPKMRQKLKRCTFTCADLGADVPGRLKSPAHKHMQKLQTWSLQNEPPHASDPPEFKIVRGGGISQEDRFDVVSIQFAIHYMMSTRQRARRFFQTVSELLEVGGNLIVTTIDARVVIGHMMNLGLNLHFDDDNPGEEAIISVGNGACQIRFEPDKVKRIFKPEGKEDDLFGLEYTFTLVEGSDHGKGVGDAVNLPEWLTPIPVLKQLAEEAGLLLEYAHNFHEFYALRKHPVTSAAAHSSLYNMKVLNRNGSIAPDEWEISRLYVAIKFRKVRESTMKLDDEEVDEEDDEEEKELPEINPTIKAKLLPMAMLKAKKRIGDDAWKALSSEEKTRLTDAELRKMAFKN